MARAKKTAKKKSGFTALATRNPGKRKRNAFSTRTRATTRTVSGWELRKGDIIEAPKRIYFPEQKKWIPLSQEWPGHPKELRVDFWDIEGGESLLSDLRGHAFGAIDYNTADYPERFVLISRKGTKRKTAPVKKGKAKVTVRRTKKKSSRRNTDGATHYFDCAGKRVRARLAKGMRPQKGMKVIELLETCGRHGAGTIVDVDPGKLRKIPKERNMQKATRRERLKRPPVGWGLRGPYPDDGKGTTHHPFRGGTITIGYYPKSGAYASKWTSATGKWLPGSGGRSRAEALKQTKALFSKSRNAPLEYKGSGKIGPVSNPKHMTPTHMVSCGGGKWARARVWTSTTLTPPKKGWRTVQIFETCGKTPAGAVVDVRIDRIKPLRARSPRLGRVKSRSLVGDARSSKLGGPGYLARSDAARREILRKCVKRFGFNGCLGSIAVLEVISEKKKGTVQRAKLQRDRRWLVTTFGKGSARNCPAPARNVTTQCIGYMNTLASGAAPPARN